MLDRLQSKGLTPNKEKCVLGQKSLSYLYTVSYRNDSPTDIASHHAMSQSDSSRAEKVAEEFINFVAVMSTPLAMSLQEIQIATQAYTDLQHIIRQWISVPCPRVILKNQGQHLCHI